MSKRKYRTDGERVIDALNGTASGRAAIRTLSQAAGLSREKTSAAVGELLKLGALERDLRSYRLHSGLSLDECRALAIEVIGSSELPWYPILGPQIAAWAETTLAISDATVEQRDWQVAGRPVGAGVGPTSSSFLSSPTRCCRERMLRCTRSR